MKTFFFALILGLFILIPVQLVFADEPISSERFKDRQLDEYANGTRVETFGKVPYILDGNTWVDRKISGNGTHFNVYSDLGSFSFDKTSCTITQYRQGFNPITQTPGSADIVIGDWFWTVARKNGTNPWEVIDPMIFGCSISTSQNATGKYLTMTRTHVPTGSYLKVTLAAPQDRPVEDFAELYMNVPAWSGNKFAFVLWAKDVRTDSLVLRNGTTISIPQGVTMIDKSQLTVNSLDFIKDGNAFFFDWKKANGKFKTLLLNKTGAHLDVQFGFNNNAATLTTGQRIFLDPTYGYATGTRTQAQMAGVAGAACSTTGDSIIAGTTGIWYKESTAGAGAPSCYATTMEYDITTIPDGRTITDVKMRVDIDTVTGDAQNCDFTPVLLMRPTTTANTANNARLLFNNITQNTPYVNNNAVCAAAAANTILDLGTQADADVQSQLSANWFAVGTAPDSLVRNLGADYVESATGDFELQVTYSTGPPNAVTTLAVTDFDADSVDLAWSAPSLNNGTLQLYQVNYTTPCGIPLTALANGTTATSYIVSGLDGATCYSFRATAVTEGGRNVTGANIVNATTLAFNQANFTIGNLSFDAENPDVIPIFFERDDINDTSLYLNVTYPDTWQLACDFHYKFAMTNQTYDNLAFTTIDANSIESSFQFNHVDREIINVFCWDENGTGSGRYLITQTNFPLLEYIQRFDDGRYGTAGNFGAFDLVYLAVVIVSLVGLNRTNESVGAIFMIVITAAMASFEFITVPTAAISGIGLAVMLIIISTRRD